MAKKLTLEIILSRRTQYQIDNYDYSEAVYVNNLTKLKIFCKVCNKFFYHTPSKHTTGQRCGDCSIKIGADKIRGSLEECLAKFKTKWGDLYDYSKAVYINYSTKLEIVCREHGSFWKTPGHHIDNQGCPTCSKDEQTAQMTLPWDVVYSRLTEQQLRDNDYSEFVYTGMLNKSTIICRKHGRYTTCVWNHTRPENKVGCQECYNEIRGLSSRTTQEEFINRVNSLPGPKRDTSKAVYVNNNTHVILGCSEHGTWYEQTPLCIYNNNQGCKQCSNFGTSKGEQALGDFLESAGVKIIRNDRTILGRLELDVVIPEKRIALEYDGLRYHSEEYKPDKNYHLNKTVGCEKAGYRLLHIYEDEWLGKEHIVKSRLMHILGISTKKLAARKLKIVKLNFTETSRFLTETHIQGPGKTATHSYGLTDNDDLVACMTFCKERFMKSNRIELLRFSSKFAIQGGFSRLLKAFIKDTSPVGDIVSFSDKRWSVGNVYSSNGFRLIHTTQPGYDYVNNKGERFSRQNFMKYKLKDLLPKFDENLSEVENCRNNEYYRIWNCGMDKWVYSV